jgi:hypothetical protein
MANFKGWLLPTGIRTEVSLSDVNLARARFSELSEDVRVDFRNAGVHCGN